LTVYLEQLWPQRVRELDPAFYQDFGLRPGFHAGGIIHHEGQWRVSLLPNDIPSILAQTCQHDLTDGAEFFSGFAEAFAASVRQVQKPKSKTFGDGMLTDIAILLATVGIFLEGPPRKKIEFYRKVAELIAPQEKEPGTPLQQKQREDQREQLVRSIARRCENLGFELSRDRARWKRRRRKK